MLLNMVYLVIQDCALIPWFVRGYVLEHFRQLQLPPQRCTKVRPFSVYSQET